MQRTVWVRAAGHKLGVRRTHTVSQYITGGRGRGRVYPRFAGWVALFGHFGVCLWVKLSGFLFPFLGALFGETPLKSMLFVTPYHLKVL